MSYQPRGKVKTLIDHLQTNRHQQEWSTQEVAEIMGLADPRTIYSHLNTVRRHEMLYAERRGNATVFSLEPFPEEEVERPPFNAALWADGELVLYGAQENEDGSITLDAAQTAQLCRLLHGQGPEA